MRLEELLRRLGWSEPRRSLQRDDRLGGSREGPKRKTGVERGLVPQLVSAGERARELEVGERLGGATALAESGACVEQGRHAHGQAKSCLENSLWCPGEREQLGLRLKQVWAGGRRRER